MHSFLDTFTFFFVVVVVFNTSMFLVEAVEVWVSTLTGSNEPLSRLPLWTFKVAKLILMCPEIDRTTVLKTSVII